MLQIESFSLRTQDYTSLHLPKGTKLLAVSFVLEQLKVHCLVDKNEDTMYHRRLYSTVEDVAVPGHLEVAQYIGCSRRVCDNILYHVFEVYHLPLVSYKAK